MGEETRSSQLTVNISFVRRPGEVQERKHSCKVVRRVENYLNLCSRSMS